MSRKNQSAVDAARGMLRLKVDAKTQARVDKLARKCNEGNLTAQERAEYESYVAAGTLVAIARAKALLLLAKDA